MADPTTPRGDGADDRPDVRDLLPAYALDAVDDVERRAVERLLAADPDARRELDEYRDVVAAFTVESAP
ncbi:MAG: RskA family anti-sigma factor, partial [Cellulosimicrobium funkei]